MTDTRTNAQVAAERLKAKDSTTRAYERDRCRRIAHEEKVCPVCGWEDTSALQRRERRTNAANDLLRRKASILRTAFPTPSRDLAAWEDAISRYHASLPPRPPQTRSDAEAQLIDALSSDESEAYAS